jgi:hypothetical protein
MPPHDSLPRRGRISTRPLRVSPARRRSVRLGAGRVGNDCTEQLERLLDSLTHLLSPEQTWELNVHANNGEHRVVFALLCSMLETAEVRLSGATGALLIQVGEVIGAGESAWRNVVR